MEHGVRISRRRFVGGFATALGYAGLRPGEALWAQGAESRGLRAGPDYDTLAKLGQNENPYGPSEVVLDAMRHAFKYANRYGYPDANVVEEIAAYHGVKAQNVVLGAGSGELLDVIDLAFLANGKKVVGTDPTFEQVYSYATATRAQAIKVPLLPDYRLDMPGIIAATKHNYRDVGFVYICNPNNPTGQVVSRAEIVQLLESIPGDVPVLIDEAYHHFVDDPTYSTSIPFVTQGQQVIVTRTFSKIAALAGVRLGYAIAPKDLIDRLRPLTDGSVSAIAKHAGVAALKDIENESRVRSLTIDLRRRTIAELKALGYDVVPSQTNFFMVHVKTDVTPVIAEFRKKGIIVGRKFPPMVEHLRVSVGTEAEMSRFLAAFREIFPGPKAGVSGGL